MGEFPGLEQGKGVVRTMLLFSDQRLWLSCLGLAVLCVNANAGNALFLQSAVTFPTSVIHVVGNGACKIVSSASLGEHCIPIENKTVANTLYYTIIILDFSSAYDIVNHMLLCKNTLLPWPS